MTGIVRVQFKEGSTVFSAGDLAEKLYVVEKGVIQLLDARSGRPLATLVQGSSFGEQCMLSRGVRSATAIAREDAECIEISGEGLRQLLAAQSPLMISLVQALLLQLHMHNSLLRQA